MATPCASSWTTKARAFPPAERARVFEAYERLARDQTSERTGSGLGLAIVRHIARLCGGDAWLEDASPRGTRAVIELPRGNAADAGAGDIGRRMSRILLIEDNRDYAATLASNLEREGYDVAIAATGTAGLAEAKTYRPDLIVLDLMLPAMNGYGVLQRLRDEGRETPVLIMTARGTEEEKLRGFDLGADDYIVKPCGLREFLARVKALLKRSTGAVEPRASAATRRARRRFLRCELCDAVTRLCRLRPKEFDLLAALIRHRGRVCHSRRAVARGVGIRGGHAEPNGRDASCRAARPTR